MTQITTQHQTSLLKMQQLSLLVAAMLYPLWGYLLQAVDPQIREDISGRFLVSGICFILVGSMNFIKAARQHSSWLLLFGTIIGTSHFYYLTWLNLLGTNSLFGLFITVVCCLMIQETKLSYFIYMVFLAILMIPMIENQIMMAETWIFIAGTISFMVIFYLALKRKIALGIIIQEQATMLADTNKFTAMKTLAGGLAHEINNPLAIILAYANIVSRELDTAKPDPEELKKHMEKIAMTVNRIAHILYNLRILAHEIKSSDHETLTTARIIDFCLTFYQEKFADAGIILTLDIDRNLKVNGNLAQIGHVLVSILSNAYDAVEKQDIKKIQITTRATKDYIEFYLSDNGPGIPKELQSKIMDPFFTTKDTGKGVGLGLSIAKNLTESMGGQLILDPTKTQTTFVLRLPCSQELKKAA